MQYIKFPKKISFLVCLLFLHRQTHAMFDWGHEGPDLFFRNPENTQAIEIEPFSQKYCHELLSNQTAFATDFNEIKARIFSYMKRADRKAVQKENALLFDNFTTESLGQFITPDTTRIKATFAGDNKILLFRFKERQWGETLAISQMFCL